MRTLVALVALGGCSFGLSRPPTHVPHGELPHCTTSGMLPSFDALSAAANFGTGAVLAVQAVSTANGQMSDVVPGLEAIAVGAVYGVAALYGAKTVRACRRMTSAAVATLVADATTAANANDCSKVLDIALHLADSDPEAYETYVHEPALASCF
jgi:hypothetical protein